MPSCGPSSAIFNSHISTELSDYSVLCDSMHRWSKRPITSGSESGAAISAPPGPEGRCGHLCSSRPGGAVRPSLFLQARRGGAAISAPPGLKGRCGHLCSSRPGGAL
ncbi:hypothetical protein GDO78_013797 [Eleutherodactylus coqui]|uniref:Uncharacterized protein n=1 Tax=Eleutherodactylus coqui TaxID=57060 RepID=A0A8J6JX88_ELECQ|nr:hypothetical protein GDO78_013797 [Eleutherodactylus coqui]